MAFTETFKTLPDQLLEALEVTQQLVLTNVSATAASTRALSPTIPALPFADRLPDPVSLTDNTFDFATKVLASQRDFSLKLLAAWLPETAKREPAKAAAAK
jgi:hypothetical protein